MATPAVEAVLLLDANDGSRIHAKYYSRKYASIDAQKAFEKKLQQKSKSNSARSDFEITMIDNSVAVYRQNADSVFFVIGSLHENELILMEVLKAFYESLGTILRQHLEKKNLLMNLDVVLLVVDELIDGGLIMVLDPLAIANRVLMRNAEPVETNLGDMTVAQALETAKKQFAKSWMSF